MSSRQPPRLAEWLLRCLLRMPDGEHILGDLREEYAAHLEREDSRLAADVWYWRQVGTSIPSLLARALRGPGRM